CPSPGDRVSQWTALLYRIGHRRRVSGCGDLDRRLRAAAVARDDDHGDLYRRSDRRLYLRPTGRGAAAELRLAKRLYYRRRRAVADGRGAGAVAAGIAALSCRQKQVVGTSGGPAASP